MPTKKAQKQSSDGHAAEAAALAARELLDSQVRTLKREGLRLCQIVSDMIPASRRRESALGSIRAGIGLALEEVRATAELGSLKGLK